MVLTESQFSLKHYLIGKRSVNNVNAVLPPVIPCAGARRPPEGRIDSGRKWIRSLPQTVSYANGRLGDK